MLKDVFFLIVKKYYDNPDGAEKLWPEIEKAYTAKSRDYHNLQHLQNMYNELLACKEQVNDWETTVLSLFYHDIIYKATAKDNEEKSAGIAVKRLTLMGYPKEKTIKCRDQILATKSHALSNNNDTNLFTDADLAILGSPWDIYAGYCQQVRREYAIYPDFLYKPGRKKVLQHFLAMKTIFKTGYFIERYETAARINLEKEAALLIDR